MSMDPIVSGQVILEFFLHFRKWNMKSQPIFSTTLGAT